MFNIANHQGNANQNHIEILSHTCQNDYHQKENIINISKYEGKEKENH